MSKAVRGQVTVIVVGSVASAFVVNYLRRKYPQWFGAA